MQNRLMSLILVTVHDVIALGTIVVVPTYLDAISLALTALDETFLDVIVLGVTFLDVTSHVDLSLGLTVLVHEQFVGIVIVYFHSYHNYNILKCLIGMTFI